MSKSELTGMRVREGGRWDVRGDGVVWDVEELVVIVLVVVVRVVVEVSACAHSTEVWDTKDSLLETEESWSEGDGSGSTFAIAACCSCS
jgi:hypothetical protein